MIRYRRTCRTGRNGCGERGRKCAGPDRPRGANATRVDVDAISTINEYLTRSDWRVNANANQGYSLGGMMLNTSGKVVATLDVVLEEGTAPAPALAALRRILVAEYHIDHVTIEPHWVAAGGCALFEADRPETHA